MSLSPVQQAIILMHEFAVRTGLDSDRPAQRYLWTDAFAVCNYLGLGRATGEPRLRDLALRLTSQVHHTLGRYRHDASRSGWISGLAEQEGEAHPTRGGLRIGKALPERGPQDPLDERLEWERDGQYFHYLTKWMHALDQLSRATREPRYNRWARELAATAHRAFTASPGNGRPTRMYWKMSIDLSHPLVTSMGQHDPLDGYITTLQLDTTAARFPPSAAGPDLTAATRQFAALAMQGEWASPDPLGIGGLLVDAYRVTQLIRLGAPLDRQLIARLLRAVLTGLRYYSTNGELQVAAEYRLAFRELGLVIGLQAGERLWRGSRNGLLMATEEIRNQLEELSHYFSLGEQIRAFWLIPGQQHSSTWEEHRDINEVTLATSLAPDGFLELTDTE
jgi:hypothetical protein